MIGSFVASLLLAPNLTLAVKVEGDGYLRFGDRGRVVYARSARLVVSPDGRLAHANGNILLPSIEVPATAQALGSDIEGRISATVNGEKKVIGRFVLAFFEKGQALMPQGAFFTSSSRPALRDPGEDYAGVIRVEGGNDPLPVRAETNAGTQPSTSTSVRNSGVPKIVVPESVAVSGERVLLGDIATILASEPELSKLKAIDLGNAPVSGTPVRFTQITIQSQIRRAGFTQNGYELQMGGSISVSREGQVVTHAEFVDAAVKAAQAKMGAAASLTAELKGPDFFAPRGRLELRMESMTPSGGLLSVVMAVYVDGKRLNSRTIKLSGDGLTASVKAGQLVKVRMVGDGYVAEISGRSKQNGILGQTVEVTIQYDGPGTTSTHVGTVVGNGIVEVKI